MAVLKYQECRDILNEIKNGTVDPGRLEELLRINRCNLEEFVDRIQRHTFEFRRITTKTHARQLKADIKAGHLSDCEKALLLKLNHLSGDMEEMMFELEKVFRKQDMIKRYKDEFEAAKAELMSIDSIEIDLGEILKRRKAIQQYAIELREDLKRELQKIEAESFEDR